MKKKLTSLLLTLAIGAIGAQASEPAALEFAAIYIDTPVEEAPLPVPAFGSAGLAGPSIPAAESRRVLLVYRLTPGARPLNFVMDVYGATKPRKKLKAVLGAAINVGALLVAIQNPAFTQAVEVGSNRLGRIAEQLADRRTVRLKGKKLGDAGDGLWVAPLKLEVFTDHPMIVVREAKILGVGGKKLTSTPSLRAEIEIAPEDLFDCFDEAGD